MSQAFSLYSELTVRQNLELHAQLYHLPANEIEGRIKELLERYDLKDRGRRQAGKPAARHQAAAAARGGGAARAGHAHSRRADLGRRSGRARRFLAHADRPLPRRRRHDLPLDPLHERGRALRPHLADASRQGARRRRAEGAGQGARQRFSRGRLHQLSGGSGGADEDKEGRGAATSGSGATAGISAAGNRPRLPNRARPSGSIPDGCGLMPGARPWSSCAIRSGWRSRSSVLSF